MADVHAAASYKQTSNGSSVNGGIFAPSTAYQRLAGPNVIIGA